MIKKSKPEYEIVPVFQTRPAGQSAYDKFVKKLSRPLTKKQKENIHRRMCENIGVLDLKLDCSVAPADSFVPKDVVTADIYAILLFGSEDR